jgi:hypothetical protein
MGAAQPQPNEALRVHKGFLPTEWPQSTVEKNPSMRRRAYGLEGIMGRFENDDGQPWEMLEPNNLWGLQVENIFEKASY